MAKKTADDYIDSTLYAKTTVDAYLTVDANGNGVVKVGTIQPNKLVGRVYSWIEHNGRLWWQIDQNTFPDHQYIFVEHKQGIYHQPTDIYQPPKTPKSLGDTLISVGKYALWAYLGVSVVKAVMVAEIGKSENVKNQPKVA